MSFLAWAFGLGLLAVGFPLLFHLIRRTPSGRQVFSSLMFLDASPPRLSRRSRWDEWLLLLLRAAAVILLALAFMRPFVRETAFLAAAPLPARRVVLLVDQSASMQRNGLWTAAQAQVDAVLDDLDPGDDISLLLFAENSRTLLDFDSQPTAGRLAEKKSQVRAALAGQRPGWGATHLGAALVAAADALEALDVQQNAGATLQVALVSDLQRGAVLDALQNYQWPPAVLVDLRSVAPATPQTNAAARLLTDRNAVESPSEQRVRISNASDSPRDQFAVGWGTGDSQLPAASLTPVAVQAGTSQVLRLPQNDASLGSDRLLLQGDEVEFDNQFFVVPRQTVTARVVYWGSGAADDPQGMRYYLQRALPSTPLRQVEVVESLAGAPPDLIVATGSPSDEQLRQLQTFVSEGGTALLTLANAEQAAAWQPLIGEVAVGAAAAGRDYHLLAELDFSHPLLQPLAAPPYNDFTKIRFWQTTPIERLPADAQRIASFDDGHPALWSVRPGRGVVYCLAASWAPAASQLALSSKFVTLLNALLDSARPAAQGAGSCRVGDLLPLPALQAQESVQITSPAGATQTFTASESPPPRAEVPGIYRVTTANGTTLIAANLAAGESEIAALPGESLRELGVTLGRQPPRAQQLEQLVRLKDLEFEGRQKIWKWLVLAAVLALLVETFWSARRRPATEQPASAASLPTPARSTP